MPLVKVAITTIMDVPLTTLSRDNMKEYLHMASAQLKDLSIGLYEEGKTVMIYAETKPLDGPEELVAILADLAAKNVDVNDLFQL